jgi:uncharacterized phage infection (PIP) family protein YhgE
MSQSQILQYVVKFSYDAQSLQQIKQVLNQQNYTIKLKFDSQQVQEELERINKSIINQTLQLRNLAQQSNAVNQSLQGVANSGNTASNATAQAGQQLNLFTQANQQLTQQQQRQLQLTNQLAQARQQNQGGLADMYQSESQSLLEISRQIGKYKAELAILQQMQAEGMQLSDEDKLRKQGLFTAIKQLGVAYGKEREAILGRTEATIQSQNATQSASQAIEQSYTTQIGTLSSLKDQITAVKGELATLDSIRREEGQLTEEQRESYEVLQATLGTLKQQYREANSEIQRNEQAQRNLGKTTNDATKDIIDSYKPYSESLSDLTKKQNDLRAEIKELQDAQKSSSGITDEQSQRLAQLQLAYREVGRSITQIKRDANSTEEANRNLGNSYQDMQARMRQLSVEIRNTQDPLGQNKDTVAKLTAEYNELNQKLKDIDGSMGNHQRNVGNYIDSIRQAASAIAVFQGPLGPLSGRLNSVATLLSKLKDAQISAGVASLTLGKMVQKALIASGFGVLLVVLGSVISFLKKSEEGNDALRVSTAKLGAVVSTVTEPFIQLGKIIYNTLSTPEGFSEFMQRLGRVEIFGTKLKDVFDRLKRAFYEALVNPQVALKNLVVDLGVFVGNITGIAEVFNTVKGVITDAFNDPRQAVADLWETIKESLIFRAQKLLDTFKFVGGAIKSVMELDFDALKENYAGAVNSIIDATTGVDDTVGKVAEKVAPIGQKIKEVFQNGVDSAKDFMNTLSENVEMAEQEQKALNDIQRELRALGVERAQQNRNIQEARRFARENRYELEEGIRRLNEVIEAEEKLAEKELDAKRRALEIKRAQTDRFSSTSEELQELADMEIEFHNLEKEHETNRMRLVRDRNTLETKMIQLRYKREKNFLEWQLQQMDFENKRILYSRRGMLQELIVAEKEYTDVFGNELLKQQMLTQYHIEETARLEAAGFKASIASVMAYANAVQRIEQEELEASKKVSDIRRKYKETVFDAIKEAGFRSAEALFGESKLLSSAETIVDTLKGAQRAFANNPPPSPIGIASASAVLAKGVIALRKINATKKGDKSIQGAGGAGGAGATIASAQSATASFGLVDPNQLNLPAEIASQLANSGITISQPNIILSGEFDPEFLSVKVQEGNNIRSGETVGV